ncbi:uncharacterized protein LOC135463012 [Liolophura sinensis]|uniref:uncharacterized protein LOC135463012 n=1 Tax=Liolophura sinensis TaxID=3198878 RepID=UPI003158760F
MVKSEAGRNREDEPIISRGHREVQQAKEDGGDSKGLGVLMTTVFMIGEVAGVGMLAIPKAVDNSGYVGFAFLMLALISAAYTALILGRSWVIVEQRYPEFRGAVRFPYPALGQVTYGRPGRFIAVGAVAVTLVACGVLLANIAYDGVRQRNVHVQHTIPSLISTCMAFGPIVYAVGGHPVFPTIQNDMKDPTKFDNSVYFSYITILFIYMSVCVSAYFVYGRALQENILLTVSRGPMSYIVQVLITAHLLFGFIIIMNPVCQDIEQLLGVPKHFTWKRCLSRSAAVVFAVIIAVSVPSFGVILSLVGGSTMALLIFVCPLIFYHKLSSMEGEWEKMHISMLTKLLNYSVMAAGIAEETSAAKGISMPTRYNDQGASHQCSRSEFKSSSSSRIKHYGLIANTCKVG